MVSTAARATKAAALLLSLAGFCASARAQSTLVRVVDEPTRLGIGFVEVTLLRADRPLATTVTDTLGFFRLPISEPGKYVLRLRALGYIEQTADLELTDPVPGTLPAFVLKPIAFSLDPLVVRKKQSELNPNVGFTRSSRLITGEHMARLRDSGFLLEQALRQIGGLLVRSGRGGQLCVESTRRMRSFGVTAAPNRAPASPYNIPCQMIEVVVDNFPMRDPDFLATAPLDLFESIEYLSPADAGFRYGLAASTNGALVLWTRGRGPFKQPTAWIPTKTDRAPR